MTNTNWKLVHTQEISMRWCDMDAFGHVNNSVYFSYFEIARIAWWHAIATEEMQLQNTGPVLINASCTFYKPIVYPETISVKLYVGPPGRSSYEHFYQLYSQADPNVLYADGITKVVWVDRKAGRSIPLPEILRTHLLEN